MKNNLYEMKTIILPGYSPHNKDWAEDMKTQMRLGHDVIVHNWKHWVKGSFSYKRELDNVLEKIGDEKVNIIAKSIGTRVALGVTEVIYGQINRMILCGLPGVSRIDVLQFNMFKKSLNLLLPERVLIIQNENDPFGSFEKVSKFVGKINPGIKVVSKPGSDHNYPYPGDFKDFLE